MKKLIQVDLGELIGVQRAQVSKLENSATNVKLGTSTKDFDALYAKLSFRVHKNKAVKMVKVKRLQVT